MSEATRDRVSQLAADLEEIQNSLEVIHSTAVALRLAIDHCSDADVDPCQLGPAAYSLEDTIYALLGRVGGMASRARDTVIELRRESVENQGRPAP